MPSLRWYTRVGGRHLLGMAHGIAGPLYALLAWAASRNCPPATGVHESLSQLAARSCEVGSALAWPRLSTSSELLTGWCNGASGFVQLWCMAYRVFREPVFLDLATRTARYCIEGPPQGYDLCCGRAGCTYALLAVYRATGEAYWYQRASEVALESLQSADRHESHTGLFKGVTGVLLSVSDLLADHSAAMPLLGEEP
ncbi:MAG: lanthionine synthetase LanC family protein [Candidatus Xenobia bacterium]